MDAFKDKLAYFRQTEGARLTISRRHMPLYAVIIHHPDDMISVDVANDWSQVMGEFDIVRSFASYGAESVTSSVAADHYCFRISITWAERAIRILSNYLGIEDDVEFVMEAG